MAIKFAKDIVKEIKERGPVSIPDNCIGGDDFERWLIESKRKTMERMMKESE